MPTTGLTDNDWIKVKTGNCISFESVSKNLQAKQICQGFLIFGDISFSEVPFLFQTDMDVHQTMFMGIGLGFCKSISL